MQEVRKPHGIAPHQKENEFMQNTLRVGTHLGTLGHRDPDADKRPWEHRERERLLQHTCGHVVHLPSTSVRLTVSGPWGEGLSGMDGGPPVYGACNV